MGIGGAKGGPNLLIRIRARFWVSGEWEAGADKRTLRERGFREWLEAKVYTRVWWPIGWAPWGQEGSGEQVGQNLGDIKP